MSKKEALSVKRFVMRKSLIGKGQTIHVKFKDGREFLYDHDKVYNENKSKFESMPCWAKYSTYTSTTNIPTFAREHAKQIAEATESK